MPQCSIIIPVYNRVELTRMCLDKLLASPPETCEAEIIVINDGSDDTTERLLAGYGDRIRVVVHPQNMGYGTACNNGAAVASGDYLVFLNNDTIPLAGWLDALLHYAGEQKGAGAVGSKLIFPNGTIQHCGMVLDQERQPRHIYE